MKRNRDRDFAFTLIELLIVVAIIAILAAIAVPNFLEAQMRSKLSRVKADMRTMATAMEAYRIDQAHYPVDWATANNSLALLGHKINYSRPMPASGWDQFFARWVLTPLTTPIAFIASLPSSGFDTIGSRHSPDSASFRYDAKNHGQEYTTSDYLGSDPKIYPGFPFYCLPEVGWNRERKWRLRDPGPDLWFNNQLTPAEPYYQNLYDPSNGTVSMGDILRWGP